MQDRPAGEFDVLIAQDGGVAKARRILAALLKKEQQQKEKPKNVQTAADPVGTREPAAPRSA